MNHAQFINHPDHFFTFQYGLFLFPPFDSSYACPCLVSFGTAHPFPHADGVTCVADGVVADEEHLRAR